MVYCFANHPDISITNRKAIETIYNHATVPGFAVFRYTSPKGSQAFWVTIGHRVAFADSTYFCLTPEHVEQRLTDLGEDAYNLYLAHVLPKIEHKPHLLDIETVLADAENGITHFTNTDYDGPAIERL